MGSNLKNKFITAAKILAFAPGFAMSSQEPTLPPTDDPCKKISGTAMVFSSMRDKGVSYNQAMANIYSIEDFPEESREAYSLIIIQVYHYMEDKSPEEIFIELYESCKAGDWDYD